MRRAPVLPVLLLSLFLAAPSLSASPAGTAATAPEGSDWIVGRVDVPAAAWAQVDGWWQLELLVSLDGTEGAELVSLGLGDGPAGGAIDFPYYPFVHTGITGLHLTTSRNTAPGDMVYLLILAVRGAPEDAGALGLRAALGPAAMPTDVVPLAAGAGSTVAALSVWDGGVVHAHGVEVATTPGAGLTPAALVASVAPSGEGGLTYAEAGFALDTGAARLGTAAQAADERLTDARLLLAPLASGMGAYATGASSAPAAASLDARWTGDMPYAHMTAISIPVDLAALGHPVPSSSGLFTSGGGFGTVWIGDCALPHAVLGPTIVECVRSG